MLFVLLHALFRVSAIFRIFQEFSHPMKLVTVLVVGVDVCVTVFHNFAEFLQLSKVFKGESISVLILQLFYIKINYFLVSFFFFFFSLSFIRLNLILFFFSYLQRQRKTRKERRQFTDATRGREKFESLNQRKKKLFTSFLHNLMISQKYL